MNNPNTFSWTGSDQREDNTPYLPEDRRGFNVYIFTQGGAPGEVTFTAISQAYDFSMPISDLGDPLTEGDYSMVVTDVDNQGRESGFSAPVDFSIVVALPKPPTGLSAS